MVKLGGLKDLRSKSLNKRVGRRRREVRRGAVSLETGSSEIPAAATAAATGEGKMVLVEMGLMGMVMRGHWRLED